MKLRAVVKNCSKWWSSGSTLGPSYNICPPTRQLHLSNLFSSNPNLTSLKPPSASTDQTKYDALNTSFEDTEASFRSKSTKEVFRAYIVYKLCSINFLVDNNVKILKWLRRILGKKGFEILLKATFYGHFVAGEDENKIIPTLQRLHSFGVKTILDYSVEEDISSEEAQKLEMDAIQSELEKKGKLTTEENEIGGPMPQYHHSQMNQFKFNDRRYKVTGARTYFYLNEPSCEKNLENFQKCLVTIANSTSCPGFMAVKLTALGKPQLLLQLSEVIMRARNFVGDVTGTKGSVIKHHFTPEQLEKKLAEAGIKDTIRFLQNVVKDKDGIIHLFPWSGIINENLELNETFRVPCIKDGRMVRLTTQLSKTEEAMFRNMIRRCTTLINTAKDLNVRLMIDAEQTYFQPAISRICMEMMNKYNKDRAIVFNTYQCYLQDTFNEVLNDLEQANRQKFYFGAKLVRGAYVEQERERAAEMNYPDPTCPTFEATSEMYHKTLEECMRRMKALKDAGDVVNKVGIMVASHNEDTVRFAINKMNELGLSTVDKILCFGQLYGMCDYITFPLGQAGYSAYKYVPYGPVEEVLPYLSRRATENKSVLKKLEKERRLLLKELVRRIRIGKLFYKPTGKYSPMC